MREPFSDLIENIVSDIECKINCILEVLWKHHDPRCDDVVERVTENCCWWIQYSIVLVEFLLSLQL